MKTLATQVRLRRLLRVHAELLDRLPGEASTDASATEVAAARLHGLVADVERAWREDAASARRTGVTLAPEVERYVSRALKSMDAAAGALARPGAATPDNAEWLRTQFREFAVPLQFMLAGLDVEVPATISVRTGAA